VYRRAPLLALLCGTSLTPLHAQDAPPAPAAEAEAEWAPPAEEDFDEEAEQEIVVTGSRPRGSVVGDIEPEVTLDRRAIRAYGAGNLAELVDALAPQTRSGRGRGGGPVVLLNGRRISGFREIRDIPPEAVERVEVLPEEVALNYGYRAEQRVVNIVLRRRFRAITTEVQGGVATEGGRESYGADGNLLRIDPSGRWSVDVDFDHAGALLESERDLILAEPELARFRTLLPETDRLELEGAFNRFVFGDVSATVNAGLEFTENKSLLGLPQGEEGFVGEVPLLRESDGRTGHLGLSMNGDIQPWRWSLTANYDNSRTETRTERGIGEIDLARSTNQSADAQAVFNGPVVQLPAGDVRASVRVGADTRSLDSRTVRSGLVQLRDLSRDRAAAQASLDIPISSRRRDVLGAIGDLSANFNFEVEELSDFGRLTTIGAGARWEPTEEVDLALSVSEEDGAPTIQQLGDPTLLTPNVRVFDFVRGETVDVNYLSGGNPDLEADSRRVLSLRMTARPLAGTDLTFVAEYNDTRIRNPIASFPTATPEIEAAFPERFVRDEAGRLLQIDSRPVNFARSDTEELRWGFNFSKPIGPQGPTPEQRREWRERMRQRGAEGGGPPQGGGGQAGRGGGRGFGGGGFGRFGGGGGGGRLQLALYHRWRFTDEISIRPGVPVLDLLNGSAVGNNGGRPRHEVEVDAGLFLKGFGARLTGTWQSGTIVRSLADDVGGAATELNFGDLARFNLRLFADLNQQRALVRRYPFLRGARVSLAFDNIFDARLQVRNETGVTPISYQPALLDPLGRSVRLTVRKQFFSRPNRAGFGRGR
jgi:hypothetical protein